MTLQNPTQMPDNVTYEGEVFHVIHGLRRRPPHIRQPQLPPATTNNHGGHRNNRSDP